MILIIKHIDIEGPGTLGDFLKSRKYNSIVTDLGAGQHLPKNFKNIDAVICLGGPMNVYEEDKFPFLRCTVGKIPPSTEEDENGKIPRSSCKAIRHRGA